MGQVPYKERLNEEVISLEVEMYIDVNQGFQRA